MKILAIDPGNEKSAWVIWGVLMNLFDNDSLWAWGMVGLVFSV